ncbi:hypothetical protein, partial [Prevotella dentalis]|uniref:hypothetical protein n=1 Tax=Prevotella dentalis TaxID=52227 RepID=UPI00265888A4
KEKLQIVSIFRFGHKKRGLFQCPPLGRVGEGLLCLGNSVGVAISRRRYTQLDNSNQPISIYYPAAGNAFG